MLSAKSFRPSINSFDTGVRWLRIFTADIFSRLVEEGVLENKRRPKTINLHHRQGAQTRSKQAPIPSGRTIDENALFELAKNLLAQVVVDGRAWPCANLSLSVAGFEDGITGNKGIGSFLVRGEEAKAMNNFSKPTPDREDAATPPPGKRRKVDGGPIKSFFGVRQESTGEIEDEDSPFVGLETDTVRDRKDPLAPPTSAQPEEDHQAFAVESVADKKSSPSSSSEQLLCTRCNKSLALIEKAEHEDWHFAKDLQSEDVMVGPSNSVPKPPLKPEIQHKGRGRGRPAGGTAGRAEKGQSKLAFG